MEAQITLDYADPKAAQAVARAVSPDNFKTPVGLSVKTVSVGCEVTTVIECEGKLTTFTATIDDLLSSVSIAEKIVGAIVNNL